MNQQQLFSMDNPVIYITDDTSQNQRTLTLTNQSGSAWKLKGGTPVSEINITPNDPTSLYLTFGDVLTTEQFKNLQITAEGWQAQYFSDSVTNWALTPKSDLTLPNGGSVNFTLSNVAASGQPRPDQLTLDYYNIPNNVDSSTQITILLQNLPSGPKTLQLLVSFLTGNSVYTTLEEGSPIVNSLIFRLSNSDRNNPIVPPDMPWGPNPPLFTVSFVYGVSPGYGALTTVQNGSQMDIDVAERYKDSWKIQKITDAENPYWELIPQDHEVLGIGTAATVEFNLKNIITDFAVGSEPDVTLMYIQYANIPGYNDGFFTLTILKKAGPSITSFYADPASVPFQAEEGPTTLYWKTENTDSVTFDAPGVPDGLTFKPKGKGPLQNPITVPRGAQLTLNAVVRTDGSGVDTLSQQPIQISKTIRFLGVDRTRIATELVTLLEFILTPDGKSLYAFQSIGIGLIPSLGINKFGVMTLADQKVRILDFNSAIDPKLGTKNSSLSVCINPEGSTIYAFIQASTADQSSSLLWMAIDTATNGIKMVANLVDFETPQFIIEGGCALSPDGNTLYALFFPASGGTPPGKLWVLDTQTFEVRAQYAYSYETKVNIFPSVFALSPDGTKLYVKESTGFVIYNIVNGLEPISTLDIQNMFSPQNYVMPYAVATRDKTRLYGVAMCVTDNSTVCPDQPNLLLVVDVDPHTFEMTLSQSVQIGIGQGVYPSIRNIGFNEMALSADESTLYVYLQADELLMIDTSTYQVQRIICGANKDFQPRAITTGLQPGTVYSTDGSDISILGISQM